MARMTDDLRLCRLLPVLGLMALFLVAGLPAPAADVLDASGTADVAGRLQRDPTTGKAYLPRQELDKKALLRRFEELFKEFTTRNQKVEQQYFDHYPLIYVPDVPAASPASGSRSISPSSGGRGQTGAPSTQNSTTR